MTDSHGQPGHFAFSYFPIMSLPVLRSRKGFTLIELLLVVGVIGILASIVITAINPNKQLADGRNARRRSDVNAILNAVYQYVIDNQGNVPGSPQIDTNLRQVCAGSAMGGNCGATAVQGTVLWALTGSYIVKLPMDPLVASNSAGTAYNIQRSGNGRITVSAPKAEQGVTISVSR